MIRTKAEAIANPSPGDRWQDNDGNSRRIDSSITARGWIGFIDERGCLLCGPVKEFRRWAKRADYLGAE